MLKANEHEKERLRNDLNDREKYTHPRWEVEQNFINKERDTIERRSTNYWSNGWNVIEALCLFLSGMYNSLSVNRRQKDIMCFCSH